MALVPMITFVLVLLATYAVFCKLAAFLFRRTQLGWGHGFALAVLMLFVLYGTQGAMKLVAMQLPVPQIIAPIVSVLVAIAFGGWYLGSQARKADGQRVGWTAGVVITLIGFGLLICVGVVLILAVRLFSGS